VNAAPSKIVTNVVGLVRLIAAAVLYAEPNDDKYHYREKQYRKKKPRHVTAVVFSEDYHQKHKQYPETQAQNRKRNDYPVKMISERVENARHTRVFEIGMQDRLTVYENPRINYPTDRQQSKPNNGEPPNCVVCHPDIDPVFT